MFYNESIVLLVVLIGMALFSASRTESTDRLGTSETSTSTVVAPPSASHTQASHTQASQAQASPLLSDTTQPQTGPPPLSADARAWTGNYRGRLDGERARLTIEASPDDRRLIATLTDASNTALRGSVDGSDLSARSPNHVMPPLHLSSPECAASGPSCRRLVLQRLHLHTWGRERRISGEARTEWKTVGVVFTEGRLPAPRTARPAAAFSDQEAASVWRGRYVGRLDGRPVTLTVRRDDTAFHLTLDAPYDGPAYAGTVSAEHVQGHVFTIPTLVAPDGRAVTSVRLYLHTQNTGYVSGTATVQRDGRPGVTAGLYAVRIGDSRPVADR